MLSERSTIRAISPLFPAELMKLILITVSNSVIMSRFQPGLNWRPTACEAHVPPATHQLAIISLFFH